MQMKCDAEKWCRGVYLPQESITGALQVEAWGVREPSAQRGGEDAGEEGEAPGHWQRGQNRPGSRGSKKDLGLYPESTEEPLKYFKQGDSIFRFSS